MVVQLSILVGNVVDLLALGFTHVQVWVSEDEGNSFFEITDAAASAAILDSALPLNNYRLGGKLLKVQVNEGTEYSISFSSLTELWTPAQVVSRIEEVVPGLASVVDGKVRLTSPTTSRASSLKITYSDGVDLGWSTLPASKGKDARITLLSGTQLYLKTDMAGRSNYRYKWRYSVGSNAPFSDFSSPPVYGKAPETVDPTSLSVATGKFIGMDGKPIKGKLIISTISPPQNLAGFVLANNEPLVIESDDSGYFQLTLVRGLKVRVALEGTAFVREFTVPAAATFDMLQAMADAPDTFTVQVPPPFLVRRSI